MPDLSYWFSSPKNLPWEQERESPWGPEEGEPFFSYPLAWLVPYAQVTEADIAAAPRPLWITDIHPDSSVGLPIPERAGTFVVSLPSSFEKYLEELPYEHRKRARWVLKKNSDLDVSVGTQGDIDVLWNEYASHISELNVRLGGNPYTASELAIRRELYAGGNIELLSFRFRGDLWGVNVSLWKDGVVFDLALLTTEAPELKKRSLGTLAVLKNIESAIRAKYATYDLLIGDFGTKHRFGAVERKARAYIACSRRFAAQYAIPETVVSEWLPDE